jgi:hypothetical protein
VDDDRACGEGSNIYGVVLGRHLRTVRDVLRVKAELPAEV